MLGLACITSQALSALIMDSKSCTASRQAVQALMHPLKVTALGLKNYDGSGGETQTLIQ